MKVFTMTIQPGEFWIADIPFTNAVASEKRPVLVLWLDDRDVVAAAVNTAKPRTPLDVLLADWKASGLRKESTVRLSRLDCLEQSLLICRIGVSVTDGERVKQTWSTHIRPQF
jgi:mRNA interferase MazF